MATKKVETKKEVVGKYEVFEQLGFFKYVLKASNGEILIESEPYTTQAGAKKAIASVKDNLESDSSKLTITKDKRGLFQFSLTSGNNRKLVISANYASKAAAEKASESFKRFAANSDIFDAEAPKELVWELIKLGKITHKENGKIVIDTDDNGCTFELRANNGAVLCESSFYANKTSCLAGLETFKEAIKSGKFYVAKDKSKNYQFKLYTEDLRLVAVGQSYDDKESAKNSAISVASFIKNAELK